MELQSQIAKTESYKRTDFSFGITLQKVNKTTFFL